VEKGIELSKGIRIPTSLDGDFFKYWYEFLKPFHKLTDKEVDILSCFARKRYQLLRQVEDPKIVDRLLMSEEGKHEICEEAGISYTYFRVCLCKFRKRKVIIGNSINPKFLPTIPKNGKVCNLLIQFDLSNGQPIDKHL